MADFNPDSADRKLVLHSLTAKHERIISIIQDSQPQGFVTWQADSGHDNFYKALQIGLSFLRTNCFDEWVVVGSGVFAMVRGMPIFAELDEPEFACGMIYAGNIRKMRVYVRPWPDQVSTEFYIGHENSCVKAAALDFPAAYGHEQPQEQAQNLYNPNMVALRENVPDEEVYEEEAPTPPTDNYESPLWKVLLTAFTGIQ